MTGQAICWRKYAFRHDLFWEVKLLKKGVRGGDRLGKG